MKSEYRNGLQFITLSAIDYVGTKPPRLYNGPNKAAMPDGNETLVTEHFELSITGAIGAAANMAPLSKKAEVSVDGKLLSDAIAELEKLK